MSARTDSASRARRGALREELYDRVKASDLDLLDAVRMMRKVAGKSQTEYARLVGISPRVLIDFERGVGNPTLETLRRMLDPFGLELTVRRRRDDDSAAKTKATAFRARALRGEPAIVLPDLRRHLAAIVAGPDVDQIHFGITRKPIRDGSRGKMPGRIALLYEAASLANALEVEGELFDSFANTGKIVRDFLPAPARTSADRAYLYVSVVKKRTAHEADP